MLLHKDTLINIIISGISLLHKAGVRNNCWIMLGLVQSCCSGGLLLTAVDATTELVGAVVDGTGLPSAWPGVDAF